MAKHSQSRKHHRTTHSETSWDGFSGLDLKNLNPFGKDVSASTALVGAGLGLAVGAAIKFGLNKLNMSLKKEDGTGGLPDALLSYAGPISTFLAGLAMYVVRRAKADEARSLFFGSTRAALTPIYWTTLGKYGPKLKDGTPFFSDYVMSPYGVYVESPYGALTEDQYGALTEDSYSGYGSPGDPFSTDEGEGALAAP